MKTKDEIVQELWSLNKKRFVLLLATGVLFPCALLLGVNMETIKAVAGIVSFMVLGMLLVSFIDLLEHRKGKISKVVDLAMDTTNEDFVCLGYAREHFHPEMRHLPDELKILQVKTNGYEEFEAQTAAIPVWFIPIIFIGGFGFAVLFGLHPWKEVLLSFAPYLLILMGVLYVYCDITMTRKIKRVWYSYFTPIGCKVNLKESLPEMFGQYDPNDAVKTIVFVGPKYSVAEYTQQVATNFVAYIKKQYEERTSQETKDAFVV